MNGEPSAWVTRWSHLLPANSNVLDVACGAGRHSRWLAGLGHRVTAIDRDTSALQSEGFNGEIVTADLESGTWPLSDARGVPRNFDGIVITNYLHRPLFPVLLRSLSAQGVFIYETFAKGNTAFGRPTRPEFLLEEGELLRVCEGLQIIAYESGYLPDPARVVQRIAARITGAAVSVSDTARFALK